MWIKSKVIVFFGINDRFAGMYVVDNEDQILILKELFYDFPYYYKVYDDIPRLTEAMVDTTIDPESGDITAEIKDINRMNKRIKKNKSELNTSFEKLQEKIKKALELK